MGSCDIDTHNVFLNAIVYYIIHPFCNSVQIAVYLYIFWRKKLNHSAQQFMALAANEGFMKTSGALPDAVRNNTLTRQSKALRNSQMIRRQNSILLGMSEHSDQILAESADSSDVKNEKIAEDFED